jgi:hypothetical protein
MLNIFFTIAAWSGVYARWLAPASEVDDEELLRGLGGGGFALSRAL